MRRCLAALAFTPLLLFAAPEDKLPADLALVPHDALWFVSARAGDIAAARVRAAAALLPSIPDPAKEAEKLGLKESDVERVTVFQRRVSQGLPVAVLRTAKALDRKDVLKHLGAERAVTVHGKTVHVAADGFTNRLAVHFADDRTALIGFPSALVP
ncbi:MAG: hypothetical protein ACRC33_19805, partial [Gemmataceae bacterium]